MEVTLSFSCVLVSAGIVNILPSSWHSSVLQIWYEPFIIFFFFFSSSFSVPFKSLYLNMSIPPFFSSYLRISGLGQEPCKHLSKLCSGDTRSCLWEHLLEETKLKLKDSESMLFARPPFLNPPDHSIWLRILWFPLSIVHFLHQLLLLFLFFFFVWKI